MKALGISRRIDDLGRIVIPKEIRRNLHIREGDALEFFVEDGYLVLRSLEQEDLPRKMLDLADELDYNTRYFAANKLRALAKEIQKDE